MKLEKLLQLKQKLTLETDLSKVWLYFMDNFADYQEFTDLGNPARHAFLESVIPQICQQMFGKKIKIKDLLIIYLPEYHFFHGPFDAEGRIGGFIYFEDSKIGEIAVSEKFPRNDLVKYSRFSESFRLGDLHDNN